MGFCPECEREIDFLLIDTFHQERIFTLERKGGMENSQYIQEFSCPYCKETIALGKDEAVEILGRSELENEIEKYSGD